MAVDSGNTTAFTFRRGHQHALTVVMLLLVTTPAFAMASINGTIDRNLQSIAAAASLAIDGEYVPLPYNTSGVSERFHISQFTAPTGGDHWTFALPAAGSVCIAINGTIGLPVAATIWELGAALRGLPEAQNGPFRNMTFRVVEPGLCGPCSIVLRTLVNMQITGFTDAATWPTEVRSNPRVVFSNQRHGQFDYLRSTPNSVVFVPLSRGLGFPCASIAISNASSATYFKPKLTSTSAQLLRLSGAPTHASDPHVTLERTGDTYPFIGPVLINIGESTTSCDIVNATLRTMVAFVNNPVITATLSTWGFGLVAAFDRLLQINALVTAVNTSCTADLPVDVVGGSSSSEDFAAMWWLDTPMATGGALQYIPRGSRWSHRGMRANELFLGVADYPITPEEAEEMPNIVSVPAVGLSGAVLYNLPGVDDLVIPRCLLLSMFNGDITRWDDPRIRDANPTAGIPPLPIRVVGRPDGKGMNLLQTTGLRDIASTCPGIPASSVPNATAEFPFATSEPLQDRIIDMIHYVQRNSGTLGFAAAGPALSQAVSVAGVLDEASGVVMHPTIETARAALIDATVDKVTGAVAPTIRGTTYPFVGATYFLLNTQWRDERNCSSVRRVMDWALHGVVSERGHEAVTSQNTAHLPDKLTVRLQNVAARMTCGGRPVYPRSTEEASDNATSTVVIVVLALLLLLLLIVGVAHILLRESQRQRMLARCPMDETLPFVAMFVRVPNEVLLREFFCEPAVRRALRRSTEIAAKAVNDSGCHIARVVDEGTLLIVAKAPEQAVKCSAEVVMNVCTREDWSSLLNEGALLPGAHLPSQSAKCRVWVHIGLAFGHGRILSGGDAEAVAYHGDVVESAAITAEVAGYGDVTMSAGFAEELTEVELRRHGNIEVWRTGLRDSDNIYLFIPHGYRVSETSDSSGVPIDDGNRAQLHRRQEKRNDNTNGNGNKRDGVNPLVDLGPDDGDVSRGESLDPQQLPLPSASVTNPSFTGIALVSPGDQANRTPLLSRAPPVEYSRPAAVIAACFGPHAVTLERVSEARRIGLLSRANVLVVLGDTMYFSMTHVPSVSELTVHAAEFALGLIDAFADRASPSGVRKHTPASGAMASLSVGIAAGRAASLASSSVNVALEPVFSHAQIAQRAAHRLRLRVVAAATTNTASMDFDKEDVVASRFVAPIVDVVASTASHYEALDAIQLRSVVHSRNWKPFDSTDLDSVDVAVQASDGAWKKLLVKQQMQLPDAALQVVADEPKPQSPTVVPDITPPNSPAKVMSASTGRRAGASTHSVHSGGGAAAAVTPTLNFDLPSVTEELRPILNASLGVAKLNATIAVSAPSLTAYAASRTIVYARLEPYQRLLNGWLAPSGAAPGEGSVTTDATGTTTTGTGVAGGGGGGATESSRRSQRSDGSGTRKSD